MYEHNALGYWSGLTLCLTKVRSSRARCPATALILSKFSLTFFKSFQDPSYKEVQVGKDQEKAQSERDSHSKNRGGKKNQTNNQALIP